MPWKQYFVTQEVNLFLILLNIGDQNMAIQWLNDFGNSENTVEACLHLLQKEQSNRAILFGILKLLVQRVLLGWSQLISIFNLKSWCP